MLVLWAVLFRLAWAGWTDWDPRERLARGALLAVLLPVPQLLYWAEGREVYPAVNPDSGGATGAALLGSTLGIVTIFLLLPWLLRLPKRLGLLSNKAVWAALAASWAVFALIDHGHTSHHAVTQIAALGLLLLWIPLLGAAWANFAWPGAAAPWRRAALAWWALLVASGWVSFLPGVSEALKFTHGLVGHAHLAMAGVVTAVNGMMLTALAGRAAPRGVFARWQAGCALYVAAMLGLGAFEAEAAGDLFRSAGWTQALLGLRLLGGLLMLDASGRWLVDFWRKHD
jgi:cytochrome c oxidase cbb3-type subunit 1